MPRYQTFFLPECHADTALVRFIIPEPLLSIHEKGCSEVAKSMLSPKADDYRLIGIVDNDKKLNIHCKGFFGTFETVSQYERLTLKKHPIKDQYIIIVDKAVETFLLWNAEAVGMAVSQYGFDTSPKKFGLQLKTPTIETDPSYLQLLNDLYQHQAPGLLTLESLLHGFIEGTP